jgi:hypothetical protein
MKAARNLIPMLYPRSEMQVTEAVISASTQSILAYFQVQSRGRLFRAPASGPGFILLYDHRLAYLDS